MQKFATPAPITAVLDVPAGRIRFIAADRADTTVEVRPTNAVEGTRREGGGAGHGRVRRRCPADRGPRREAPVLRTLRVHRGDGRTARRFAGRGDGVLCRVPGRRTARRRRRRGVRRRPDRRGRERARRRLLGDVTVGRLTGPAEITIQKGDINIGEATADTVVLRTQMGNVTVAAAHGVSASLDAGTRFGRIHNTLHNSDGAAAGLTIHATTDLGDIVAREPLRSTRHDQPGHLSERTAQVIRRQGRARRRRPRRPRRNDLLAARPERRRQDHRREDPVDPHLPRRCVRRHPRRRPRPRHRPAGSAGRDRCHRPVLRRRRPHHRRGEHAPHGRPAPPVQARGPPRRRRAAGALRPHRRRQAARLHLLRRHEAPPRPRHDPGRQPADHLPRRADHRPRPPQPPQHVADHPQARRRRRHRLPHHPVPGRGRRARRPHRRARRRQAGCRGHRRGTEAADPRRPRPAPLHRPGRLPVRSPGAARRHPRRRGPRAADPQRRQPARAAVHPRPAGLGRHRGRRADRAHARPRRRVLRPDRRRRRDPHPKETVQ